jgi:hypothetical protein
MILMKQRGLGLFCCVAALLAPGVLKAQSITIHPGYTTVGVNQTVQYTAAVTGLANKTVTWSVSGVKGGNSTNGTITTGGLYTAPATIPANGITVSALGSDGRTSAIVYVAIDPAGPSISSISPNPIPVGSYTITLLSFCASRSCSHSGHGMPNHIVPNRAASYRFNRLLGTLPGVLIFCKLHVLIDQILPIRL